MEYFTTQTDLKEYLNTPFDIQGVTLMLCLKGSAVLSVDFQKHALRKGDIAFLSCEMSFIPVSVSSEFQAFVVSFPMELCEEAFYRITDTAFWDYLYLHPVCLTRPRQYRFLRHWFFQVQEIINGCREYREELLSNYLCSLYMLTYRELKEYITDNRNELKKGRPLTLLSDFTTLLTRHYHRHRDVNYYASRLSITPDYLGKLTYKLWKVSPKELIDRQILQAIKTYLTSTDLSVKSIAVELNFEDPSYLCRFFRKMTGMAPLEFRNKRRGQPMNANKTARKESLPTDGLLLKII